VRGTDVRGGAGVAAFTALVARLAIACAILMNPQASWARIAEPAGPAQLSARHAALAEKLNHNQFDRPIHLESSESSRDVAGEVYALFDYPFAAFSAALRGGRDWCDVLVLHVNTKYCRAVEEDGRTVLEMGLGAKNDQSAGDAYRMDLDYRRTRAAPDYFAVQLQAQSGPLGTSNYRILVEAVPVEGGRTFMHFTYAYSYGLAGKLAMQAYLGTAGRGKVGFTVKGQRPGGEPEYVGGVRGAVERNVMRYYLAIDAFLGALRDPPAERLEKRLQAWFTATERYPRQLAETSRAEYLDMKRSAYRRQQQAGR
jgi:hypothetical protein